VLTVLFYIAALVGLVGALRMAGSAGRWLVVRALGVRGAPFPFGADARWSWTTASLAPQTLGFVGSFVAMYGVLVVLVSASLWKYGMDDPNPASVLVRVEPGGPADLAGIRDGDRVDTVNGEPVASWEAFRSTIAQHPGEAVELSLTRDGHEARATVTPDSSGHIRVRLPVARRTAGWGECVRMGAVEPVRTLYELGRSWVGPLTGSPTDLAGPVGIVRASREPSPPGASMALLGKLGAYLLPFLTIAALLTGPGKRSRRAKKP
jgi:membrane-associated protease RseP (regulator of RpoE activity)